MFKKLCFLLSITPAFLPWAKASNYNVIQNIDIIQYVPCANYGAGEDIELKGPLHTILDYQGNIGSQHITGFYQVQPQGITGTGLTSGATYHATGMTKTTFDWVLNGTQQVRYTYVNNFRIVGDANIGSLMVHENLVLVFDPKTFILNSYHDNFSLDCK